MAPLVKALEAQSDVRSVVGVTGQHRSMLKQAPVMRDVTERPEAIGAGTAVLVGTNSDANARAAFARNVNPYGDGRASARIVAALAGRPFKEFKPVTPRAMSEAARVMRGAFA